MLISCQHLEKKVSRSDSIKRISLEEGKLSDFIKELPASMYKRNTDGVEIFSAIDTTYHPLDEKSFLVVADNIKCLVVQKEENNYYYVFENRLLATDGSIKSDSLNAYTLSDRLFLISYHLNQKPPLDTVIIKDGKIEIEGGR
jgi:hypothetical protein